MTFTARLLILWAVVGTAAVFGQAESSAPRELNVVVGKALVIDSPVDVIRVSVSDPSVVEAVGISPAEILLNGKSPGQTSVIVWQKGGNRLFFDVNVTVRPDRRIDIVRRELSRALPDQDVQVGMEGDTVYLRGTVGTLMDADRAASIASTLGKDVRLVNLLNVNVGDPDPQILLKVRFAEVSRGAQNELGINWFSSGALNTFGRVTTGQFSPPQVTGGGGTTSINLTDALNIFLFRPDLDLGATIKALESKSLAEILAEPNVLTINGKEASFLAGGEYPYPVVQGGGMGFTPVTIQFREFGIRLSFTPVITSRNTLRLKVNPEVSALDFGNGFVYQGFNIPALVVRRVVTEIELSDRQSFAIAGLLDNRFEENLNKIPWIGDIPLLGKLFQSRAKKKNKGELVVVVTPEIVRPIPAGQKPPDFQWSGEFLKDGSPVPPRTPGTEITGQSFEKPTRLTVPVELFREEKKAEQEKTAAPGGGQAGGAVRSGGMR